MFDFLCSFTAIKAVWHTCSIHNISRDGCPGYLKCRDRQPDEHDCTEQHALLRIRLQVAITSLSVVIVRRMVTRITFTARRTLHAYPIHSSVHVWCPSATSGFSMKTTECIDLVFGTEATFGLFIVRELWYLRTMTISPNLVDIYRSVQC